MLMLIVMTILYTILALDVIIVLGFLAMAWRRRLREEDWRKELYEGTHPKLKYRYPELRSHR